MAKPRFELSQFEDVCSHFLIELASDKELSANVKAALVRLSEEGNSLGAPISEPLEEGIFELRPHSSNREARLLYYFKKGARKAVIVHCFIKKTQKTAREDIDMAKSRRKLLEELKMGKGGTNGHRKAH